MNARAPIALLASLLAGFPLTGCSTPAQAGDAATFAESTNAWHAERIDKLSAPDGWLSLVALAWLEEGPNRVGRATGAEVSYPGLPADHVGTLAVTGDEVVFEPAPGARVEGVPADGYLFTDADGAPTILALGDIRFHVVVRGERLAVRMKDAAAPTRTTFAGIERFPANEAWRITADFVPARAGETIVLDTVLGVTAEANVAGHARFEWDGTAVEAVLFASGDGSLLRFADTTNTGETYPIGRYLYVDAPAEDGTVVLDMNRAYNPPCAFTEFATCSLAPAANRFPFPVESGEKKPRGH